MSKQNPSPVLIVNADDFGLTDGVNRAVEEAHARGILTSTTVLVGAEAAEAVTDVARRCPELGIGLHVNLTHGSPLLDPARVSSLVDADGMLVADLRRRSLLARVDARQVFAEVSAQAGRLRALGIEPTHWDSHQGIAFWPGIVKPAAAALAEAGFARARTHRSWGLHASSSPSAAVLRLGERLAGTRLRRFATPARRTSAGFVQDGSLDYAHAWSRLFGVIPGTGVTEIVCHPGHVDDTLRRATPSLVDDRAVDLAALLDPGNRATLAERGFELRSFAVLERSRPLQV